MKMVKIKTSLLSTIATLLLLFSGIKDSKLTQITKPYLGEYECKEARFGAEDYLDRFSFITLELKADDTFLLSYCEKNGKKREIQGKYTYDDKMQEITLFLNENEELKRTFPLKKGQLYITAQIGKQLLFLQFKQK
jgi:hypothetical protein